MFTLDAEEAIEVVVRLLVTGADGVPPPNALNPYAGPGMSSIAMLPLEYVESTVLTSRSMNPPRAYTTR